ncbi:MAG: hypothetical protein RL095_2100 [Verrucomicrobiota bacterium]|jgi:acid stress-induced BolA-like protein IbaG/YrbA
MNPRQEIEESIRLALPGARIVVDDPDGRHFSALVIASQFEGLPLLKRHRLVTAPLKEALGSDRVHALGLRTLTPAEAAAEGL